MLYLAARKRVTWGIFSVFWEAHGPPERSSGDEGGTAGVHLWQRVGPKRVQGRPCAPKYMFYNGIKATPKVPRRGQKGRGCILRGQRNAVVLHEARNCAPRVGREAYSRNHVKSVVGVMRAS